MPHNKQVNHRICWCFISRSNQLDRLSTDTLFVGFRTKEKFAFDLVHANTAFSAHAKLMQMFGN